MFPGRDITMERSDITKAIIDRRNPLRLSPLELLSRGRYVGKEILTSDMFVGEDPLYMLYEHPVHRFKDRLHLTPAQELAAFLNKEINPETLDGIDVTVTNLTMDRFLICNHDGEMFLLDWHDSAEPDQQFPKASSLPSVSRKKRAHS